MCKQMEVQFVLKWKKALKVEPLENECSRSLKRKKEGKIKRANSKKFHKNLVIIQLAELKMFKILDDSRKEWSWKCKR